MEGRLLLVCLLKLVGGPNSAIPLNFSGLLDYLGRNLEYQGLEDRQQADH